MSRLRRCPVSLALALAVVAALLLAFDASASDEGQRSPIVVRIEPGGFRWSDAAVGALAGIGITLAAAGCVVLVRPRGAGNPRTNGEP